jgi:hypothetical protein
LECWVIRFRVGSETLGVRAICNEVFLELDRTSRLSFDVASDSHRWRRNYQPTFAKAVSLEFTEPEALRAGLARFRDLAEIDGQPLNEVMVAAFENGSALKLHSIVGDGRALAIGGPPRHWLGDAEGRVAEGSAEPGLLVRASKLDALAEPADLPLLFAFAGAAELAATREWLSWGGRVLVLARSRPSFWEDLIRFARESGGELLVPIPAGSEAVTDEAVAEVAGFDVAVEPALAAEALRLALDTGDRVLFGHFGYSPGITHLQLQVVAEVLSELAMARFAPEKLHFSWLATPSDSIAVPIELQLERVRRFRARPLARKLADLPWQLVGQLREPRVEPLELASGASESAGEGRGEDEAAAQYALVDASTTKQGPSYSLAKRTQRWRAQLAAAAGFGVSYQVTPPAKTRSVLGFKILRATYRGAPRYGTHPYEVVDARRWPAALAALDTIDRPEIRDATDLYLPTAIHGGLWRTEYETDSAWLSATLLGLVLSIGAKPTQLATKL